MRCQPFAGYILGLLAVWLWFDVTLVQAVQLPSLFRTNKNEQLEKNQAAAQVPMEKLPASYRDKVSQVLAKPTVYTKGPQEAFVCQPDMYRWFLEHPDRAAGAWRKLGAKCVDINDRGNGVFGWSDGQGSDVTWRALHSGPNLQIWFAEGQVKPGMLFPLIPVQCVAILKHEVLRPEQNGMLVQHQADIFAFTDSKTAAMVMRMLGPSVPRMAKQGATQLQMFFGALAWFCHQHPQRVEGLIKPEPVPMPNFSQKYSPFDPAGMIYPEKFPEIPSMKE